MGVQGTPLFPPFAAVTCKRAAYFHRGTNLVVFVSLLSLDVCFTVATLSDGFGTDTLQVMGHFMKRTNKRTQYASCLAVTTVVPHVQLEFTTFTRFQAILRTGNGNKQTLILMLTMNNNRRTSYTSFAHNYLDVCICKSRRSNLLPNEITRDPYRNLFRGGGEFQL